MITEKGRLLKDAMTSIKVSKTMMLSRQSMSQGLEVLKRGKQRWKQ